MPKPTTAINPRSTGTGMRRATGAPPRPPAMVPADMTRQGHQATCPPAAKIAKHSVAKGITVREAVVDLGYVERGEVSESDLDRALDLLSMTHPGVAQ